MKEKKEGGIGDFTKGVRSRKGIDVDKKVFFGVL